MDFFDWIFLVLCVVAPISGQLADIETAIEANTAACQAVTP